MKTLIVYITILALIFLTMCVLIARKEIAARDRHIEKLQAALDRVPTIREIQKKVGAKEDGICGPDTLEKWDKKICDQYAEPYFSAAVYKGAAK